MKLFKRLSIAVAVFIVLVGGTFFWLSNNYVVPVIMYHKVENSAVIKTDTVSPENFLKHISYIADHGYNVLTLDEFIEGVRGNRSFPRNSVVITFDDGYENNLTLAVPVLKKYQFPAIFFVSPGFTKKDGFLSWGQLRIIAGEGFSIGSHGMTQAYLPEIFHDERQYELKDSRRILEKKLGVPVNYFAYPVSGFTDEIKKEVKEAGYKGAMATNRGTDRSNKDVYEINRIRLCDKDNTDFILWAKLTGYYNLFRKLKPSN
jgi:peptidoglycan/xylan/chitin deacetylase (PgdA/CDA1 family)